MDMMEVRRRVLLHQAKSGGVETYLCRNYSPNGSKFSYTIEGISLSNGDYIEISANTAACYKNNENIISIGENIAGWEGYHFHCYYTHSSGVLQVNALGPSTYNRFQPTIPSNEVIIRIDKDGFSCNGTYWSQSGQTQYSNLMSHLLTVSNISVGSQEGNTRFYGTYNYIKWVKAI